MKRIKFDKLIFTKRKYFDEDGLFTGIAYVENNGIINEIKMFEDGNPVGPYSNEYLSGLNFELCVNVDALTSDDDEEPYFYNGIAFSGMACEFINSICIVESIFSNGISVIECQYFPTGELSSLTKFDDDLIQKYEYTSRGKPRLWELRAGPEFRFLCRCDNNGFLNSLSIPEHFFETLHKFGDQLANFPFTRITSFEGMRIAPKLQLAGKGITHDLISLLISLEGFLDIEDLSLFNVGWNLNNLEYIADLGKLKELYVIDHADGILEKLKIFKIERPKAKVFINSDELILDVRIK